MRQEAVNNQKEILRLKEELRIKNYESRRAKQKSDATTEHGSPCPEILLSQKRARSPVSRGSKAMFDKKVKRSSSASKFNQDSQTQ